MQSGGSSSRRPGSSTCVVRYGGALLFIIAALNVVYNINYLAQRDPGLWKIKSDEREVAIHLPRLPKERITRTLVGERKEILKNAPSPDRHANLRHLSDRTINEVMAKVLEGDRSDLATLGFSDRDMARHREVHLKKTIVHITGRDIRKLDDK
jgi:hypothetical protein